PRQRPSRANDDSTRTRTLPTPQAPGVGRARLWAVTEPFVKSFRRDNSDYPSTTGLTGPSATLQCSSCLVAANTHYREEPNDAQPLWPDHPARHRPARSGESNHRV